MHYAPALLALAGLAAAYRIPPLTTTEWCLAKCNDVGGDSCVAACVGNPNLSAEQIHAAHECEFKCHIPSKGAEGDLACLRACHKRYYYTTTSTKAATSATTSGSLARRSDLAGLAAAQGIPAPPLATPTAISLTPAEKCLSTCNPVGDRSCVAACIGNPNLSSAQVAAAHRCYSTCPMGDNDSVEDWNAYMTCLRVCDNRYYSTISTKAATSPATSGGLARRSDLAATTTMFSITVTGPSGSTNTIISPFVSPKEACHASCMSGDWLCEAACIQVPSPYPGTKVAAIRGCQVACQEIIFNPKDHFNKYASCLLACFDSYYDPNTGAKVNPLPLSSADIGVSPRSIQAAADATTTTTFSTTTITPAMRTYTPPVPMPSTKETCLALCTVGDLQCETECILARSPFPGEVAAYRECDFACQRFAINEDDEDIYAECLDFCWHSYDYPSTNTKASAIAATNAGLGPRSPLTVANPTKTLTKTLTSAMSSATHIPSPKASCIASCGPKDIDCGIDCINADTLYPGPGAVVDDCKATCQRLDIMQNDPGAFAGCMSACESHCYWPTNHTKASAIAARGGGLSPRASLTAAPTTPQLAQRSLVPVSIIYSDASPKEVCLANPAQIAATNKCEAHCPQGNGTAAQTQFYAACLQKCVDSFYFSGTGTIAAGITATAIATTTGGLKSTMTLSTKFEAWTGGPFFGNGSSTSTSSSETVRLDVHSATGGSTASSSPTGGPASSGSAPKLGQAGGLLGLMMAMLAL
ncbi:hypothetical protein LTR17_022495 [Elasticomyces elasticus]|nr:hypothetical protein LTR17_022495 [Elasticomyces elasticus]